MRLSPMELPVLPINPLPPLKSARPLLMLGLAVGATAFALWARRQVKNAPLIRKAVRIEPDARIEASVCEVPWGTEVC